MCIGGVEGAHHFHIGSKVKLISVVETAVVFALEAEQ